MNNRFAGVIYDERLLDVLDQGGITRAQAISALDNIALRPRIKKMQHDLFRGKINREGRLIFAVTEVNGESYLVLLEVLPDHRYDKSTYLKHPEKIAPTLEEIKQRYFASLDKKQPHSSSIRVTDGSVLTHAPAVSASPDSVHSVPRTYRKKKKRIILSDQQDKAVSLSKPCFFIGAAGTGKTLIAEEQLMAWLNQEGEETEQTIAYYIAPTEALVDSMQRKLDRIQDPDDNRQVICCTPTEFLCRQNAKLCRFTKKDPITNQERDMTEMEMSKEWEDRFAIWFANWLAQATNKEKFTKHSDLAKNMYEELRSVTRYSSLAEYKQSGNRQSLFTADKKAAVWDVYNAYSSHLENNHSDGHGKRFVNAAFECLSSRAYKQTKPLSAFTVVDESQLLSPLQLKNIIDMTSSSAEDDQLPNVSLLYDPRQNVKNRLPAGFEYLTQVHRLEPTGLVTAFRCPKEIMTIANGIQRLSHRLAGGASMKGVSYETQVSDSVTSLKGSVSFVEIKSSSHLKHDLEKCCDVTMLRQMAQNANCAFIVADEKAKAVVCELFQTALVFTPLEILGDEYENIVTIDLLSPAVFKEANKALSASDSKAGKTESSDGNRAKEGNNLFVSDFSKLYVAWTRSLKNHISIEYAAHRTKELRDALGWMKDESPKLVQAESSASPMTAIDVLGWEKAVRKFIKNNDTDRARACWDQYCSKTRGEFAPFLKMVRDELNAHARQDLRDPAPAEEAEGRDVSVKAAGSKNRPAPPPKAPKKSHPKKRPKKTAPAKKTAAKKVNETPAESSASMPAPAPDLSCSADWVISRLEKHSQDQHEYERILKDVFDSNPKLLFLLCYKKFYLIEKIYALNSKQFLAFLKKKDTPYAKILLDLIANKPPYHCEIPVVAMLAELCISLPGAETRASIAAQLFEDICELTVHDGQRTYTLHDYISTDLLTRSVMVPGNRGAPEEYGVINFLFASPVGMRFFLQTLSRERSPQEWMSIVDTMRRFHERDVSPRLAYFVDFFISSRVTHEHHITYLSYLHDVLCVMPIAIKKVFLNALCELPYVKTKGGKIVEVMLRSVHGQNMLSLILTTLKSLDNNDFTLLHSVVDVDALIKALTQRSASAAQLISLLKSVCHFNIDVSTEMQGALGSAILENQWDVVMHLIRLGADYSHHDVGAIKEGVFRYLSASLERQTSDEWVAEVFDHQADSSLRRLFYPHNDKVGFLVDEFVSSEEWMAFRLRFNLTYFKQLNKEPRRLAHFCQEKAEWINQCRLESEVSFQHELDALPVALLCHDYVQEHTDGAAQPAASLFQRFVSTPWYETFLSALFQRPLQAGDSDLIAVALSKKQLIKGELTALARLLALMKKDAKWLASLHKLMRTMGSGAKKHLLTAFCTTPMACGSPVSLLIYHSKDPEEQEVLYDFLNTMAPLHEDMRLILSRALDRELAGTRDSARQYLKSGSPDGFGHKVLALLDVVDSKKAASIEWTQESKVKAARYLSGFFDPALSAQQFKQKLEKLFNAREKLAYLFEIHLRIPGTNNETTFIEKMLLPDEVHHSFFTEFLSEKPHVSSELAQAVSEDYVLFYLLSLSHSGRQFLCFLFSRCPAFLTNIQPKKFFKRLNEDVPAFLRESIFTALCRSEDGIVLLLDMMQLSPILIGEMPDKELDAKIGDSEVTVRSRLQDGGIRGKTLLHLINHFHQSQKCVAPFTPAVIEKFFKTLRVDHEAFIEFVLCNPAAMSPDLWFVYGDCEAPFAISYAIRSGKPRFMNLAYQFVERYFSEHQLAVDARGYSLTAYAIMLHQPREVLDITSASPVVNMTPQEMDVIKSTSHSTVLYLKLAVSNGNLVAVRWCVDVWMKGERLTGIDDILHLAASHGHLEIVQELYERLRPLNLNKPNKHGVMPFIEAISNGNIEVFRWLLSQASGDMETQDAIKTALMPKEYTDKAIKIIRSLCEYGINVNGTSTVGASPLGMAVRHKQWRVVIDLINAGALYQGLNISRESLCLYLSYHRREYADMLENIMSDAASCMHTFLFKAEGRYDPAAIKNVSDTLLSFIDTNQRDKPSELAPRAPSISENAHDRLYQVIKQDLIGCLPLHCISLYEREDHFLFGLCSDGKFLIEKLYMLSPKGFRDFLSMHDARYGKLIVNDCATKAMQGRPFLDILATHLQMFESNPFIAEFFHDITRADRRTEKETDNLCYRVDLGLLTERRSVMYAGISYRETCTFETLNASATGRAFILDVLKCRTKQKEIDTLVHCLTQAQSAKNAATTLDLLINALLTAVDVSSLDFVKFLQENTLFCQGISMESLCRQNDGNSTFVLLSTHPLGHEMLYYILKAKKPFKENEAHLINDALHQSYKTDAVEGACTARYYLETVRSEKAKLILEMLPSQQTFVVPQGLFAQRNAGGGGAVGQRKKRGGR